MLRTIPFAAVLACVCLGQVEPSRAIATFHLDSYGDAAVTHFVARASRLYFVVSDGRQSTIYRTRGNGSVEQTIPLAAGNLTAFDADETGKAYLLISATRIAVYDEHGTLVRSEVLPEPATAMTAVNGRPIVVGADKSIWRLDPLERRFTLAAYPGPYSLFPAGADRVGILSAGVLHVLQTEAQWSTHLPLGKWLGGRLVSAAAAPDGRVFVLSATSEPGIVSLTDCGEDSRPSRMWDYFLPEGMTAEFFAIDAGRLYIADAHGEVAYFRAPQPGEISGRPLDTAPVLRTGLERLRRAARSAGYRGTVKLQLQLNAAGEVEAATVATPSTLANVPEVLSAVRALRFQPQTKNGRPEPVALEFSASVE